MDLTSSIYLFAGIAVLLYLIPWIIAKSNVKNQNVTFVEREILNGYRSGIVIHLVLFLIGVILLLFLFNPSDLWDLILDSIIVIIIAVLSFIMFVFDIWQLFYLSSEINNIDRR